MKSKVRDDSYEDYVDVGTEAKFKESSDKGAENRTPDHTSEKSTGRAHTTHTFADLTCQ